MAIFYAFDKDKPKSCEECNCHRYVHDIKNYSREWFTKCICLIDNHYSVASFEETYSKCPIRSLDKVIKNLIKEMKNGNI